MKNHDFNFSHNFRRNFEKAYLRPWRCRDRTVRNWGPPRRGTSRATAFWALLRPFVFSPGRYFRAVWHLSWILIVDGFWVLLLLLYYSRLVFRKTEFTWSDRMIIWWMDCRFIELWQQHVVETNQKSFNQMIIQLATQNILELLNTLCCRMKNTHYGTHGRLPHFQHVVESHFRNDSDVGKDDERNAF